MDEEQEAKNWAFLPYPALINVFQYLSYKELINVSEMCVSWFEASRNDKLWRNLFYRNFLVDRSVPIASGKTWYEEFKRFCYNIPVVRTELLQDHAHQVLHVSFSHNGKYFATCSKDGYVLLWNSTYPAKIKYSRDMKTFSWKYTQFSQFNESDTLLLVSGVYFGTPHSTSGEIAVFNLQDEFQLQCRVVNKPYDIFGTWYSDQYLFSGDLHWLAHLVSSSHLWLNRASQEADSELVPITHCLYKFYNRNASSIRAIMIANCLPNSENAGNCSTEDSPSSDLGHQAEETIEHGNPVSHKINLNELFSPIYKNLTEPRDLANPIWYNSDYRKVEAMNVIPTTDSDDEMDQDDALEEEDSDSETETEQFVNNDKYLIFTTGYETYTPHQIGFKRIKPFVFPKRLDPGPSLKERLLLHEQKKEQMRSGSPPPDPDWLNYENVADKFTKVDHLIDLHGHIVGMGLSPDHRYLYVNSRSWPKGYRISNPLDPPPIAQEIDIHVIDLVTLKQVGTMFRAHKAYTPNNECFFIFLDVCNEYVASGAEDKHGYLWDRHYGVCLVKFPHDDVVNSVAFNPKDPEMLVTTSDDNTIKIWRSRAKVKKLGIESTHTQYGVELRNEQAKKAVNSRRYCNYY